MIRSPWRIPLVFISLLFIVLGVVLLFPAVPVAPIEGSVTFESGLVVPVEIANTQAERAQGLSGREQLAPGSGMLFVFDDKKVRTFWMKEMLFSIDIIWIADGQVIGFVERALPPASSDEPLDFLASPAPADYVLEVEAGFVDRNAVAVGQNVVIDLQVAGERAETP